jgi:two-component system chemotaxis response regulator CheY
LERNPVGKTILVVEDDDITREGLDVVLRLEGHAPVMKANGREALDYLVSEPAPDLILLDMLMPVMDGWQFLEERTRSKKLAVIPIILTTSGVTTREWALDHGAVGFVQKPMETEALLEEIRRCC